MDKPTEDTYTTELISVIKHYFSSMGFDAEFNRSSPSGKPDILLYYNKTPIAIIENKIPDKRLSDPDLIKQALRYAKWYKKNRNVNFYGIHNLKYLKFFKYATREDLQLKIGKFVKPREEDWIPISEFPFQIMPWVNSIEDFKQISQNKRARENLENFFLNFKEVLENKTLDLSKEVISTIRTHIEQGASSGLSQMKNLYSDTTSNVKKVFEDWRKKRGIGKPKNDSALNRYLTLMIREQIYTFILKVLFYNVLQGINKEMAEKLDQNLTEIQLSDTELFKDIFNILFDFAIKKSGDFEEIFGSNTVERLPFTSDMLIPIKETLSYISQIRWNNINIDIIGRIFESLIYAERRHLLGQHYTDTLIVDLILVATINLPRKFLDPSCGSGTFIVRALNYWKVKSINYKKCFDVIEGVDIDKLAVMLTKINLYIQALEFIEDISDYIPKIHNTDLFRLDLSNDYYYVATNPPYTRQEEMTMAFYDKDYKDNLIKTVEDITNWSRRASIYAYFLVKAGKMLREGGRLGFIVENSWMNAEYGKAMKKWFLKNFTIELVLESNVERWFEDAKIITNIIVAEKKVRMDNTVKFVYLMKPLTDLIEVTPPSNDITANERYYDSIETLLNAFKKVKISKDRKYEIIENSNYKIISVKKKLLIKIEDILGKWGIFRGPKKYLDLILNFLTNNLNTMMFMKDVVDIVYGIKTNGNELFYLPSKYWQFSLENENFLILKGVNDQIIKISKKHLKPLIRVAKLKKKSYLIQSLEQLKKDDYVFWVEDTTKIEDRGAKSYIEWAKNFTILEHNSNNRFPTLFKKINSDSWTKLSDKSGGIFLFKNAVHKNFNIYFNEVLDAQVDLRLYFAKPKLKVREKIVFAILNSVITYIGMELIGRTNLGEGALDVKISDYNKIPIVNPIWLEETLENNGKMTEFIKVIDNVLNSVPRNIEEEYTNEQRFKMDLIILTPLGFNKKDIQKLYLDLIELVKLRETRAKSK